MALVCRRNHGELAPWSALRDLEREFTRLWKSTPPAEWFDGAWAPAVDLTETEEAFIFEADVPGLAKDEIELVVLDNVVTIKGERKNEHNAEQQGYSRFERHYGAFQRSFEVPGGFDNDKVEAKLEHGVLRVTLPKREETKPKQIEVKVK